MKEQDFLTVADNWLNRTKKLAEVWQNTDDPIKEMRAYFLWLQMSRRVLKMADYYKKTQITTVSFPLGGVVFKH